MKAKASILLIFLTACLNGNAQNARRLDSVEVRFMQLGNISDSSGLFLKVVYTNLRYRPIKIYRRLEEGNTSDRFSNISIRLQMKDSTGKYSNKVLYHDRVSDFSPGHRHFDIQKKPLPPLASDTLLLNLLETTRVFWEGEYRIKVYLRVKTIFNNEKYDYNDQSRLPPDDEIKYIDSDWIYFKVNKYIQYPILDDKGRRRA